MANDIPAEEIPLINNLVNLLKLPKGSITIKSNGQPAFSLQFKGDNVLLDIIDTSFFNFGDEADDIGLFSKLKTAKKLAQLLTDNRLTFSILRKGKEALSLGYETHPTLSRLITGNDSIQIDSVKEVAKLKHDMDK
ncbi:MAG: hypothetical protein M3530_09485 [Thermoproteota archaeon]|nr:hypothetical protein [Thermoproteota archaeon]